jgi:hypothetical protein
MLFFGQKSKDKTGNSKFGGPGANNRPPRYESLARVSVNGYEGMAALKNVSQTGFRMESKTFVEIDLGAEYTMRISPEPASGVGPFEVPVEVRWAQSSPEKFAVGFMVTQAGNRYLQKYVEYLQNRKPGYTTSR